jgi:heme exporter protein B
LIHKDVLLEWRKKYSFYGILLYLASAVFLINLLLNQPESETWNVLFWVILLFVSVNAVAKSFLQESRARQLYYYTILDPRKVIISKLIYNGVLMLIMSSIALLLFILFLGNPTLHFAKFVLVVLIGGLSLSNLFTLLAAIAGKADGNAALIAILGFPIVIPQLILLSDLSKPLLQTMLTEGWWQLFLVLIALNILIILLSYILYPFLWKE